MKKSVLFAAPFFSFKNIFFDYFKIYRKRRNLNIIKKKNIYNMLRNAEEKRKFCCQFSDNNQETEANETSCFTN